MSNLPLFEDRAQYSSLRLTELSTRVAGAPQAASFESLAIFAAGSYGRLEASEYSDIDLFFVYSGDRTDQEEPRTSEVRLFGGLLEIAELMSFPKLSNDGQYLETRSVNEMLRWLGSPEDDYYNLFTIRMLMLLESKCIFGVTPYEAILRRLIASYYRDYHDHPATFEPRFLLNDIGRFWKTLLLNYENKRNEEGPARSETKQKVRNFKLKFSRMTTCFATVAALGAHPSPVSEDDVFQLIQLTPRERLQKVSALRPDTSGAVDTVLEEYAWFLKQTALPEDELFKLFDDKGSRTRMFARADAYGKAMYDVLAAIDRGPEEQPTKFLTYLVI